MTIKVYIWLPKPSAKLVGHGSIKLTNGTYISWWPDGGKGINPKAPGTPTRTLEKDIQDEAGDPDYIIEIPGRVKLDEAAIQTWWDSFKNDGKWTVLTNCCWVVEEALIKGGIEKYMKTRGMIHLSNPKQLLALMLEVQAIRVSTGRHLEAFITSLDAMDLQTAITSLLKGNTDQNLMSSISFK